MKPIKVSFVYRFSSFPWLGHRKVADYTLQFWLISLCDARPVWCIQWKNLLSDQKTFNYLSKSILGQNLSLTATLCLHSLYSFHIQIYLNLLPCNNTDINKYTNLYSFLCVIKNFTKVTSSSVCIILFLKSQLLENVFFVT